MKERKNLLIIAPRYTTFIKDQVNALAKYFNKVHVIVYTNIIYDFVFWIIKHLLFMKNTKLWYALYRKNRWAIVDEKDKPSNVKIHVLRIIFFKRMSKNKRIGDVLLKKILSYINKEKLCFDIIHAHFTWPCGYVATIIGKKMNKPTVITAHGFDIYSLPFKTKEWFDIIKDTLKTSDKIITVSRRNYEIIVQDMNISPSRVYLIYNGFDENKFKYIKKENARRILGIPPQYKMILSIGTLSEIKGHKYLIKAIKNIIDNKQIQNIKCYIIGNGILKKKLENMVTRMGLNNYVVLYNHILHSEIPVWMYAADVLVLPSIMEGNPTVMFEALGAGLPFIGTRVGGIPEIITSEDYGLLCPPRDSECLAEKIIFALNKRWDKDKIREYSKNFTWDKIAKDIYQKVYLDLL